jgi:hypothetical protein
MNVLVFKEDSHKFPSIFGFDSRLPSVTRNVVGTIHANDYDYGWKDERKNIAVLRVYDTGIAKRH